MRKCIRKLESEDQFKSLKESDLVILSDSHYVEGDSIYEEVSPLSGEDATPELLNLLSLSSNIYQVTEEL